MGCLQNNFSPLKDRAGILNISFKVNRGYFYKQTVGILSIDMRGHGIFRLHNEALLFRRLLLLFQRKEGSK